MDRRTLLAGAATALAAVAGCTGSGQTADTATSTPTPTATPTSAPPRITGRSLERRDTCDEQGAAAISTDGMDVVVEGCIVGKDGCQVPVLDSATYDADADELRVRVTTEKRTDADACTQQLVDLPYTVTVTFEHSRPGTTTVVHDGVKGERQAGQAETG